MRPETNPTRSAQVIRRRHLPAGRAGGYRRQVRTGRGYSRCQVQRQSLRWWPIIPLRQSIPQQCNPPGNHTSRGRLKCAQRHKKRADSNTKTRGVRALSTPATYRTTQTRASRDHKKLSNTPKRRGQERRERAKQAGHRQGGNDDPQHHKRNKRVNSTTEGTSPHQKRKAQPEGRGHRPKKTPSGNPRGILQTRTNEERTTTAHTPTFNVVCVATRPTLPGTRHQGQHDQSR